eukprot:6063595-Amphidinium_carterae.1
MRCEKKSCQHLCYCHYCSLTSGRLCATKYPVPTRRPQEGELQRQPVLCLSLALWAWSRPV